MHDKINIGLACTKNKGDGIIKRIVTVLALFAITAVLVGCATINVKRPEPSSEAPPATECTHDYGDFKKCDPDRVCLLCGYKPTPRPHLMKTGNCKTKAVCLKCGFEGDYGSHNYSGGNCIEPAKCSICGDIGELGSHDFVYENCEADGVCSICGETTPALGHDMRDATCTEPATCTRCGYVEGEALGHEGTTICTRCGEFLPIAGSGYGDGVVTDIDVPYQQAIWVIHFTHTGSSNFIVHSYDADGDESHLVNEIGNYDGVVLVLDNFPLTLNIQAGGNWTYEVYALDRTSDTSFSGHGDFVTPIASTSAKVWHFSHSGNSNFAVWGWTNEGRDLLVNEIGQYDADQVFAIPSGSNVFFEVTADGDWEITPVK